MVDIGSRRLSLINFSDIVFKGDQITLDPAAIEKVDASFQLDVYKRQELDSLDYIDLVVVIENNFSFKVNPEDFIRIISFQDFYTYIISRVQSKEPSDAFMAGQVKG